MLDSLRKIKAVAIDADDTLWENEPLFREAERKWAESLKEYGSPEELSAELYEVEKGNMELLGYGAKAFTLSLFETTLKISGGKMDGTVAKTILDAGYSLLHNPATPLEGVRECLEKLKASGKYRLVMLTKGDLLDQEHKIRRSGLAGYFDLTEIVSDKNGQEYLKLCSTLGVTPQEFLMAGNSLKSDVKPVIDIGGWGVFIPFRITWEHEKAEAFDSPRLIKANVFSDLESLLL